MKALLTFIITLILIFALSFLLDIPLIYNNWVRYASVLLLIIGVGVIGFKWVYQQIKNL